MDGKSGEALADYLRAALGTSRGPWQLAFTIRTDSFPELQSTSGNVSRCFSRPLYQRPWCLVSRPQGDVISRVRLVPRRAADRRESPRSTWKEAQTPEPCQDRRWQVRAG